MRHESNRYIVYRAEKNPDSEKMKPGKRLRLDLQLIEMEREILAESRGYKTRPVFDRYNIINEADLMRASE